MTSSSTDAAPVTRADPLLLAGHTIAPGTQAEFQLPVAHSPIQALIDMPLMVAHGVRPGPRIFLTAAVHGDEINGLEIIWRTMRQLDPKKLRGTVVAVPVVNGFAVAAESRYLPDRRDLNRSFPGSARGSLAARLAHMLIETVVADSDYGVDLHTGSLMRTNLPQVRANLDDPQTRAMATAFAAPVTMHASERKGSLRRAATAAGVRCLLYEGGEGLRFDPEAIRIGVKGIARLLGHLEMITPPPAGRPGQMLGKSSWVRAPRSGLVQLTIETGDVVRHRQPIGQIVDVFGKPVAKLKAPCAGVVVGRGNNPLVHQGDAVVHIGRMLTPEG